MSNDAASLLGRVRKPEYTGENRCIPCTLVNAAIALAVAAAAWFVAVELAAAVLVVSALAIYLRGYLVPGTPTLTKRYLPDRVLALFDKHPAAQETEETWDAVEKRERAKRDAVDPEQFLLDANAVGPCEREDDLCLTDEFAALVERHTEQFRETPPGREAIAGLIDVDPDAVTLQNRDYPAAKIDNRVRKWPSDGALVADVATDRALRERADGWTDVPLEQRLKIVESLRSFRETCPLCSGAVELGTKTVESCCRSHEVATVSCLECDERLLEFDPSAIDAAAADAGADA